MTEDKLTEVEDGQDNLTEVEPTTEENDGPTEVENEELDDLTDTLTTEETDESTEENEELDDFDGDDFSDLDGDDFAESDSASDEVTTDDDENNSESNIDENENLEIEEPKKSGDKKSPSFFKKKKFWIGTGIVVGVLALIYLGGALYYSNHFFYGTLINSNGCSNMTIEEASNHINSKIENYEYKIVERGDKIESIKGRDIDLKIASIGSLDEVKKQQNPFLWCFDKKNRKLSLDMSVSMDETKLYDQVAGLQCVADSNANMAGTIATITYTNGVFTAPDVPEKNIVSLSKMSELAKAGIYGIYDDMNLEAEGCYVGVSGDDKMAALLAGMNKYVATNVTYTNSEESYPLDGGSISQWVSAGEDYQIKLDEAAVEAWVEDLAGHYNSVGKSRNFTTSYGNPITISGGDYGWIVNTGAEAEALCEIIRNGETTTREPIFSQTAASHGSIDIGNTYVEVNISAQHLWFYKDGSIIVSTDFVSGDPTKGNGTTKGVYSITYTERNAVLKGQGYASPVSFWMPFNGGQGLHDAPWRGSFGGSIYMGGGSHGCVNLPYSAASSIYSNIEKGDPVIVY